MTESVRDPRAVKIAGIALNLAMKDDLGEAARYVERLNGSNALVDALLLWIDTFIGRIYPEHEYGKPLAMRWVWKPTDEMQTADEVRPSMRWAGRLIATRASDDHDGFMDLLRSVPEGKALGDCIMALLHAVAESLKDVDYVREKSAQQRRGGRVFGPGESHHTDTP